MTANGLALYPYQQITVPEWEEQSRPRGCIWVQPTIPPAPEKTLIPHPTSQAGQARVNVHTA